LRSTAHWMLDATGQCALGRVYVGGLREFLLVGNYLCTARYLHCSVQAHFSQSIVTSSGGEKISPRTSSEQRSDSVGPHAKKIIRLVSRIHSLKWFLRACSCIIMVIKSYLALALCAAAAIVSGSDVKSWPGWQKVRKAPVASQEQKESARQNYPRMFNLKVSSAATSAASHVAKRRIFHHLSLQRMLTRWNPDVTQVPPGEDL